MFIAENAIKISLVLLDKAFKKGNQDEILSSFSLFVQADVCAVFASVSECDGRERLKAAYRCEY